MNGNQNENQRKNISSSLDESVEETLSVLRNHKKEQPARPTPSNDSTTVNNIDAVKSTPSQVHKKLSEATEKIHLKNIFDKEKVNIVAFPEGDETEFHRQKSKDYGGRGKFAFSGITKTLLYIAFVLLVSFILSKTIINLANDVFAFVKSDNEITLTLPEGATTKQVISVLKDNDIIEYPFVFKLYFQRKLNNNKYYTETFKTNEITLSPNMSYDKIIAEVCAGEGKRETVRITFPEGLTLKETLQKLIDNGVGKMENYIDVIENYEYDYRFIKELPELSPDRSYRLEGYLFPDTYDFFTNESEISVINKFLENFNRKFEEIYYERASELDMTVDDIIKIASLIEREAKYLSDYPYVSSVFHNRLTRSSYYSRTLDPGRSVQTLDSDATVQYALAEPKQVLESKDTEIDHPYNTYIHKGLMPGAICNPGLEAISAALYPEKSDYFFFFTKNNGYCVFSKTYNSHINNMSVAIKNGEFRN